MKALFLFIPVLLLCGCLSQQAMEELIDQKIAANNSGYIQPALARQTEETAALGDGVKANRRAILDSRTQVSVHQDVLLDLFRWQKESAVSALEQLAPEREAPRQVPAPAPLVAPDSAPVTPE